MPDASAPPLASSYEFTTDYLLCCSDPEPLALAELLSIADDDSLRRYEALSLGYTDSQGDPALREAVAAQYERISADGVLIIAPEEGVYLAMTALGERLTAAGRTHAICTSPAYQSLYEILATTFGFEVDFWTPRVVDQATGALAFDVVDLEAMVRPGETGAVVVNFPHNPTGCALSAEEQARVAAAAENAGAFLFGDEMYRGVERPGGQPLASFSDLGSGSASGAGLRSAALGGLSKTYGLPGLRVGWVATRDAELMARMRELRDFTTICSPAPCEALALAAVRAAPTLQGRVIERVAANVALADDFFGQRSELFRWTPGGPAAGTIAMARFARDGTDAMAAAETIVEEASVLLLPATALDFERKEYFRVGLGRANFPEALEALADACEMDAVLDVLQAPE